jgi:hypothetical protein
MQMSWRLARLQAAAAAQKADEAMRQQAISEEKAANEANKTSNIKAGGSGRVGYDIKLIGSAYAGFYIPGIDPNAVLADDLARAAQLASDAISKQLDRWKNIAQTQEDAATKLRDLQLQGAIDSAPDAASKRAAQEAQIQSQAQDEYNTNIKNGVDASKALAIKNQEVANAMAQLKDSVDANTSALQSTLDPIYTQGHDALKIGYYGEGSGGTSRTVTATDFGTGAPANNNTPSPVSPATGLGVNPNLHQPFYSGGGINGTIMSADPRIALVQKLASYIWAPPGAGTDPRAYADGGMIPPGALGIISEHSPAGPQFVRAPANEPLFVSPNSKTDDKKPAVQNITTVQNFTFNVPERNNLADRQTRRQLFEGMGRTVSGARG